MCRLVWDVLGIGITDPGSALTHKDGYKYRGHFIDSNMQRTARVSG